MMKYLKLFEELKEYLVKRVDNLRYLFTDSKKNNYKVVFSGPFDNINGIKTGITYDLEFTTDEDDYEQITDAGEPFSISNVIFGKILKSFLKENTVDTINIEPSEVDEDDDYIISEYYKGHYDRKYSRYYLYLRTLKRNFNETKWEVIELEYKEDDENIKKIVLIDKSSIFWKENKDKTIWPGQ